MVANKTKTRDRHLCLRSVSPATQLCHGGAITSEILRVTNFPIRHSAFVALHHLHQSAPTVCAPTLITMTANHVLVLGAPHSGKVLLVQHVAPGATIDFPAEGHSGIIVPAHLANKYYTMDVKFFIDEYPDPRPPTTASVHDQVEALHQWYSEFSAPEYTELREALDGLLFCVDLSTLEGGALEESLDVVADFRDSYEEDEEWPGFVAVVARHAPSTEAAEAAEEECALRAVEFINFDELGENEYREKVGRDRVVELLETHQWTHTDGAEPTGDGEASYVNYELVRFNRAGEMTERLTEEAGIDTSGIGRGGSSHTHDEKEEDGGDAPREHTNPAPGPRAQSSASTRHEVDTNFDLTKVFDKLNLARLAMEGMDQKQKEKYAKSVVEDVLNFI